MSLDHPYQDLPPAAEWLRGNLHTHTDRTDGALAPQDSIDAYATQGYAFMALSDHDMLTADADYAQWNDRGLVFLPGNEITRDGSHLLHIGATEAIPPLPDRAEVVRRAVASGGFIIANHPGWGRDFNHCSLEQLGQWHKEGLLGLEIFNGTIGRLHGTAYALDLWDKALTLGHRVWGFANDDSHLPQDDIAVGWIVAGARERNAAAILDAIRAGQFYASTGVTINRIEVDGRRILVEAENAERMIASREYQMRIAVENGNRLEVEVPENAKYVRIECWGRGEQFAWTQPFWVES